MSFESKKSSGDLKQYRVILPISVSARNPHEAILKVRSMLSTGYYNGTFLRYSVIPDAPDPEVVEVIST